MTCQPSPGWPAHVNPFFFFFLRFSSGRSYFRKLFTWTGITVLNNKVKSKGLIHQAENDRSYAQIIRTSVYTIEFSINENPVNPEKRSYFTHAPVCARLLIRLQTNVNLDLIYSESYHLYGLLHFYIHGIYCRV